MSYRLRFGWVAAFLLAGCASSDLSKNSNITSEVVECLPTDAPAPSVVARAIWFANARGFGSTDQSPMHAEGVLVLAGDRLWFMIWNEPERHFDVYRTLSIPDTMKVAVDRLGSSTMLVIESHNLSFDSFELTNKGQFGSDPQSTDQLCKKLEAIRTRSSDPGQ